MSDTLKEELRDLACEWVECCGDIHLPLTKAADRIEELETENARVREALTPSGDTKAAYISEIECDCPTENWRHYVPWISIKEIMKMIRARAALQDTATDTVPKTSDNDASQ